MHDIRAEPPVLAPCREFRSTPHNRRIIRERIVEEVINALMWYRLQLPWPEVSIFIGQIKRLCYQDVLPSFHADIAEVILRTTHRRPSREHSCKVDLRPI